MFDLIEPIFSVFTGEQVLGLIIVGLIALAFFGWKGILARQTVPGLMTSLGILGTFWGVAIALFPLDFAPENMNESIEALLDGMKTAFLTSLLGLGSAIGAKAWWSRTSATKKTTSPEHEDIAGRLDAIKQAIAGDGDSSMVTQMRALRDENRAGFAQIDDLTNTIREALIKNLEQLLSEIQDGLMQQFGDNFAQFNVAVQALNVWQQEYKAQVEVLTKTFRDVAQGTKDIKENCEAIPETMENLARVVGAVDEQLTDMDKNARAIADMQKKAAELLPTISQVAEKLDENVAKVRDDLTKLFASMGEEFATHMNRETDKLAKQWGDNMIAIAKACAKATSTNDQPDDNQ